MLLEAAHFVLGSLAFSRASVGAQSRIFRFLRPPARVTRLAPVSDPHHVNAPADRLRRAQRIGRVLAAVGAATLVLGARDALAIVIAREQGLDGPDSAELPLTFRALDAALCR